MIFKTCDYETHYLDCAMSTFRLTYASKRQYNKDKEFLLNAYNDYKTIIDNNGGIEETRRDLENFRKSFMIESETKDQRNQSNECIKFNAVTNFLRDQHNI